MPELYFRRSGLGDRTRPAARALNGLDKSRKGSPSASNPPPSTPAALGCFGRLHGTFGGDAAIRATSEEGPLHRPSRSFEFGPSRSGLGAKRTHAQRHRPGGFAPISVIRVARSASRKRTWPADNERAVTGGKWTSRTRRPRLAPTPLGTEAPLVMPLPGESGSGHPSPRTLPGDRCTDALQCARPSRGQDTWRDCGRARSRRIGHVRGITSAMWRAPWSCSSGWTCRRTRPRFA